MEQLFSIMDEDKDGLVHPKDMYKIMKKMGRDTSKEEIESLFSTLDTNGDGVLEFNEFVAGMRWLSKGLNINKNTSPSTSQNTTDNSSLPNTNEKRISNLKEKNEILESALKKMVTRGIEVAEGQYINKDYAACQATLEMLDLDTLLEMEVFVGTIMSEKQKDHYTKMKRRISNFNK